MAVGTLQGSAEAVHMHNPMNVIIMSVLFINEGHLTEEYKQLFTKVGKTTNNQVRIARSGQFHNIDKSMVYIIFLHLLYAYDILPSVGNLTFLPSLLGMGGGFQPMHIC